MSTGKPTFVKIQPKFMFGNLFCGSISRYFTLSAKKTYKSNSAVCLISEVIRECSSCEQYDADVHSNVINNKKIINVIIF